MSELQEWIREPDYSEDFSMEEMIDWIERRPLAEVAAADALLAETVREREEYNGKHQAACLEIDRLKQRVAVLENVIFEELRVDDCDNAYPVVTHDR